MPDAPVFTLESVNALVPRLNLLVGEQIQRRKLIERKITELTALLGDAPDGLEETATDSPAAAKVRAEARELALSYREGWDELEQMGAVLKDPKRGLLDFYGYVDGKLVWLCWIYGEDRVSHYHGLEEGFPGRKPIAGVTKHNLLN